MSDENSTPREVLQLMACTKVPVPTLISPWVLHKMERMGVVSTLLNNHVEEEHDGNSAKNISPPQERVIILNLPMRLWR